MPGEDASVDADVPASLVFTLDEGLLLVVALEDAAALLEKLLRRDQLRAVDLIGPLSGIRYQLGQLESKLGWKGDPDAD